MNPCNSSKAGGNNTGIASFVTEVADHDNTNVRSNDTKSTRIKRIALLSASALTVPLTFATPAAAASPVVEAGASLRPCVDLANPNCSPVGRTDGGPVYKMRCWRDGSTATGNYTSQRYFLLSLRNGQEGFVHSSFVTQQTTVPNCNDLPYVRAADWAIAQIGQTRAPADWGRDYTDWAPGPINEWSGDCAKFTKMAFTRAAGVGYPTGNAIVQWHTFQSRGQANSGIPRYGDPVFYDIAKPYGHTAIYIGGLSIVSTQGMDNANLPIARQGLYTYSNYLGWGGAQ